MMTQEEIEDNRWIIRIWKLEGQTTQWPKEKVQKDKQQSTKHYTENERLSSTNPTNPGGNSGAVEG